MGPGSTSSSVGVSIVVEFTSTGQKEGRVRSAFLLRGCAHAYERDLGD